MSFSMDVSKFLKNQKYKIILRIRKFVATSSFSFFGVPIMLGVFQIGLFRRLKRTRCMIKLGEKIEIK